MQGLALLGGLLLASAAQAGGQPTDIGATRIARWQDDRTAAFELMFDDSCPSHWQIAIPELVKRGLIGTFYLNPGKAEFTKFRSGWETNYWKLGMVYADHTMTHRGVHSLAEAEKEIGDCAAIIRTMIPGNATKLLSYGQPGVGPNDWSITGAELGALLKEHHLISRPDLGGHMAVYHLKTAAEMLALADKAITNKSAEFIVIHGIERIVPDWKYQDFWALKQAIFFPFLDGIKERRDKGDLWVTDHISAYQYAKERDAATVRVLEAGAQRIRIELACTADPQFYDRPLTLVTRVPPDWKHVAVKQGTNSATRVADRGVLRYDAAPGATPIELDPKK